MKIVLASHSPRRRQLLGQMGLEFTTQSPEIDEAAFQGRDARDLVQILSREKARWIAGQVDPETLVIGADTVVVRDGEILGKPKGEEEARLPLGADAPGLRRGLSGTGWPLTWGMDSGVPARPGTGEDLP